MKRADRKQWAAARTVADRNDLLWGALGAAFTIARSAS